MDVYFDARYGTKTSGIVRLESLKIDSERKGEGQFYVATPRYEFNHLLAEIDIDPADYVFIDQGCGMGRVLLYAAMAGFRRVIGLEFSPELASIARDNLRQLRKRHGGGVNVDIVAGDAADFKIPLSACVIYFFNPFSAAVTTAILLRIKEACEAGNHDIYIIWYNVTGNAEPLFRATWLEVVAGGAGDVAQSPFLRASNLRLPYAIFRPSDSGAVDSTRVHEAPVRPRCGDGDHE